MVSTCQGEESRMSRGTSWKYYSLMFFRAGAGGTEENHAAGLYKWCTFLYPIKWIFCFLLCSVKHTVMRSHIVESHPCLRVLLPIESHPSHYPTRKHLVAKRMWHHETCVACLAQWMYPTEQHFDGTMWRIETSHACLSHSIHVLITHCGTGKHERHVCHIWCIHPVKDFDWMMWHSKTYHTCHTWCLPQWDRLIKMCGEIEHRKHGCHIRSIPHWERLWFNHAAWQNTPSSNVSTLYPNILIQRYGTYKTCFYPTENRTWQ
jgi:hypothetical protein